MTKGLRQTTPDPLYRLFLFLAILIETGRKCFCHHGRQEAKTSRCQTKNRRQSTEEKIPPHKITKQTSNHKDSQALYHNHQ